MILAPKNLNASVRRALCVTLLVRQKLLEVAWRLRGRILIRCFRRRMWLRFGYAGRCRAARRFWGRRCSADGDVLAHFFHALRPDALDRPQLVHALERAIRLAHFQNFVRRRWTCCNSNALAVFRFTGLRGCFLFALEAETQTKAIANVTIKPRQREARLAFIHTDNARCTYLSQ